MFMAGLIFSYVRGGCLRADRVRTVLAFPVAGRAGYSGVAASEAAFPAATGFVPPLPVGALKKQELVKTGAHNVIHPGAISMRIKPPAMSSGQPIMSVSPSKPRL